MMKTNTKLCECKKSKIEFDDNLEMYCSFCHGVIIENNEEDKKKEE